MPFAEHDGVKLHFEQSGTGPPLLFLHEYAGDHRSWAPQIEHFAARYHCIVLAARGYPPSDAPDAAAAYSQDLANRDVLAVLDHLALEKAHIIGLSMGAYTALQLAMIAPDRCAAVVAASGGSGSHGPTRAAFLAETLAVADAIERDGVPAEALAAGPTRLQLQNKNPSAWRGFAKRLAEHPPGPAAMTLRGVQAARPSLYDQEAALAAVTAPTLLIVGDEDESCLEVNLFLKRSMASARLAILPGSGHVLNLEEPALFNALAGRFLAEVDIGTWRPRDPRTLPKDGVPTALGLGDKS